MPLKDKRNRRILSVQSHVVSGYCGNKSAIFPIQLLGFEADIINTVQFSCHTQYKISKGQIYSGDDIVKLHDGLKANNLLKLYDHILSGYLADLTTAKSLGRLITDIKLSRQAVGVKSLYTLDPVLGDDGTGYYVPEGIKMAAAYKQELMPLADIITPNRFELSVLSGVNIDGSPGQKMKRALEAIRVLHDQGMKVVVLTSFEPTNDCKVMKCILSYTPPSDNSVEPVFPLNEEQWLIAIPKLCRPFTGTGDLFAALLSAWLNITNLNFKKSLENTVNTIHEIVSDTMEWTLAHGDDVHSRELRLVQNQKSILKPGSALKAESLLDAA